MGISTNNNDDDNDNEKKKTGNGNDNETREQTRCRLAILIESTPKGNVMSLETRSRKKSLALTLV